MPKWIMGLRVIHEIAPVGDLTTLCKRWRRWAYPITHDDGPVSGTSQVTGSGWERVGVAWSNEGGKRRWEQRLGGQTAKDSCQQGLGWQAEMGRSHCCGVTTRSSLALPSHGIRFLVVQTGVGRMDRWRITRSVSGLSIKNLLSWCSDVMSAWVHFRWWVHTIHQV